MTATPASKAHRKRELARQRAEAYRAVDLRDRGACRVCGAVSREVHHHHVRYRSLGGRDTPENLLIVCPRCHDDIHSARIRVTGDAEVRDASGLLAGLTIVRRPPDGWS